ncbi:chromatin binding [Pristimantis euphronides]
MAAAAGAPGSGEGGEAEPDSEPISGEDRPPHGRLVALASTEAEHGEARLRLPETQCPGPEVTRWESEANAPPVASEASPVEAMQLGEDCNCPPAPCPGGTATEEDCLPTPSEVDPTHQIRAAEPLRSPEGTEVLPETFHQTFALPQESPQLETTLNQAPTPECNAMAAAHPSVPPSRMETDSEEAAHDLIPDEVTCVQDPVPDVFLQEPTMKEAPEPEGQITPLTGDSVLEKVDSELDFQDDFSSTVPESVNSVQESCPKGLELINNEYLPECVANANNLCVPESFQREDKEEPVQDLQDNKGTHPESVQCMAVGVDVTLFLQPDLIKLDEGSDNSPDFHVVSLERKCQSESSPGQASVQLIMSEDVHLPEDAVSPMDSGISSELTSVEKELDSQSGHMETEPTVGNGPEFTKLVSYCQDVDYNPFYTDTKTEDSSNNAEEEHQASMAPTDTVQAEDLGELSALPSAMTDVVASTDNSVPFPDPLSAAERVVAGGIDNLIPGSEVQVTLDHIIQDALVVSFRHGDRIFSGVLMDLSKRFGPHGIPVTIHPKREYKNKPEEPIQPQSTLFQEESLKNETAPMDVVPIQSTEPCGVNNNLWTSKPPPLFHEGAPYPPPLFIRDTYNQSIPQPPPRKIKRLKKKIYREETTSIMNAIKLRPRQVLCDKCKNVVTDKREVRKTGNDSFKLEEGKRRRHKSVTTVNKKLKTDHKVNGKSQSEGQKKNPVAKVSNLGHGRGKMVKVASQTNAPKAHLHTKKVLQSKNMDHAKAREVLKLAKEKAQKKQQDASSSKSAHSKVHFTRHLQNTTSGTLPPRLRIKPQRYRNEENDSSLKIGLESLRSSKIGIKPQTRYTATRSAGEAPSAIKTPSNGPEEVSGAIQNASVCVPPGEQDEQQALSKRGSKSNITVYMTLNQTKADSSSASVCSSDSTDDLKSTHSECSSTENFDFPPGSMHAPSSSSSSFSKEEKKLSNSLKIKVFSKNVSKCVTPDGRTICVGDIVWAKIYGFPWWPARILTITISRKDNGLLVRQEASISWFGSPTTSFLTLSQLSPFLENFQSRFNKKRKGLYRKAITEAAKAAKQLTPEVRALLTQFET